MLEFVDRHQTYHVNVQTPSALLQSAQLRLRPLDHVLSSAAPIEKITAAGDGFFASTADGGVFFAQPGAGGPRVVALNGVEDGGGSGPLDDILAAKAGVQTFIENLVKTLPDIAGAVEKKVSAAILTTLAGTIKAEQSALGQTFDKSLTDFIAQKGPAKTSSVLIAAARGSGPEAAGRRTRQATHALLLKKLDLGRHLGGFQLPGGAALPPAHLVTDSGDDPLEKLAQLFAPFSTSLDAKGIANLTSMAADDLLKFVTGSGTCAPLVDALFTLFKIDDAIDKLGTLLGGGQISQLIGKIGLEEYLATPVDNAFFQAFYAHYFPGKPFTVLDLVAFSTAILMFTLSEIVGEEDQYHEIFNSPEKLAALTSAPSDLVAAIQGTAIHPAPPVPRLRGAGLGAATETMAFAADAPDSAPPVWRVQLGGFTGAVATLILGTLGVLSYGTGIIASPIVGGVAGALGQGLAGIIANHNTDDAPADLLGGFAGGMAGGFVATLFGNKLFASWATNGATPTARINSMRMIMLASAMLLGGGGGAVVSSMLKTRIKTGTISFDDPVSLWVGTFAGLGGGAMGCGLQFMGALSGGACLPVPISLKDARNWEFIGIDQGTLAVPVTMDNASAAATQNPNFPKPISPLRPLEVPVTLGVYPTEYDDSAAGSPTVPAQGISFALVKWNEFDAMTTSYAGENEKLFWLKPTQPTTEDKWADMIIGVHGIGRYVFPCLSHPNPNGGDYIEFARPFAMDDFAQYLAGNGWITGFLAAAGGRRASGRASIKLAVCFSALPVTCGSLGAKLAKALNADVYASRPPIIPYLDSSHQPRVPKLRGWIKYTP